MTKTDQATREGYQSFLQEMSDFVGDYHREVIAGNTDIINDPEIREACNSREFAFLKYINDFILPRELSKHGANIDIGPMSLRSSLSIPQLRREMTLSGFNFPINFRVSLNNTDPRIALIEHGNINVNLRAVEADIGQSEVKAETWGAKFDALLKPGSGFSFSQKPAFLAPYLDVCSHKLLSKGTNKGNDVKKFRDKYLENLLAETTHTALGIFFNEARAHKYYSEISDGKFDFWGTRVGGMAEMLKEGVFKDDTSTIKKDVNAAIASGENGSIDKHLHLIVTELYRVEARLRAIPEQNNPLATLFSGLRGIVIPNSGLDTPQPRFNDAKYRYLSEVLTTRLLTEEFLPNGKELSTKINWNELMKTNFGNEGTSEFVGRWDSYLRDGKPEPGTDGDPLGLMALRSAWYQFFDDKLGNFDKVAEYDFGPLQATAKRIAEREFMSYRNRNRINLGTDAQFQGWQEYYKQHLAI